MPHDDLHRIIYVSNAASSTSGDEVADIIAVSRARNALVDVTGVLLMIERTYFQVLEGPGDAVMATFGRIQRDPRHRRIVMLGNGPADSRYFGEWAMGYLTAGAGDLPRGARRVSTGQSVTDWMVESGDAVILRFIENFFSIHAPKKRFG